MRQYLCRSWLCSVLKQLSCRAHHSLGPLLLGLIANHIEARPCRPGVWGRSMHAGWRCLGGCRAGRHPLTSALVSSLRHRWLPKPKAAAAELALSPASVAPAMQTPEATVVVFVHCVYTPYMYSLCHLAHCLGKATIVAEALAVAVG